jgi:hypothetical protein
MNQVHKSSHVIARFISLSNALATDKTEVYAMNGGRAGALEFHIANSESLPYRSARVFLFGCSFACP